MVSFPAGVNVILGRVKSVTFALKYTKYIQTHCPITVKCNQKWLCSYNYSLSGKKVITAKINHDVSCIAPR